MVEARDSATGDSDARVRQAIAALDNGYLVGAHTAGGVEVFGHARRSEIVPRLLRQGEAGGEWTLVVPGAEAAGSWVLDLSPLETRLLRRCWPGLLTLQLADDRADVLATRLPETLGELTQALPLLGLRCPAHAELRAVLAAAEGPLVGLFVPSASSEGVNVLLHEEPLPGPDTVVRVTNERWEVVRAGELSTEQLQLTSLCVILFVCTGNTCRSPLAEALCKKHLAERLGCSPDELHQNGYLVMSAGLAAYRGEPAAAQAIEVAREHGAALDAHGSQPLDPALAVHADYVVCMTNGHLQMLQGGLSGFAGTPRLLRQDGRDIADPIGQDIEVYREVAREMDEELSRFVRSL